MQLRWAVLKIKIDYVSFLIYVLRYLSTKHAEMLNCEKWFYFSRVWQVFSYYYYATTTTTTTAINNNYNNKILKFNSKLLQIILVEFLLVEDQSLKKQYYE